MNAPDKIYLNKYMIRPGMLYPAQYPADTPEFEYIRKDALLEWLKAVKADPMMPMNIDKVIEKVETL